VGALGGVGGEFVGGANPAGIDYVLAVAVEEDLPAFAVAFRGHRPWGGQCGVAFDAVA
jgi:hypothetical protein